MTLMTALLLAVALLMGCAGALVFALAARKGQFDDLEDVKYRMLREGEDDDDR